MSVDIIVFLIFCAIGTCVDIFIFCSLRRYREMRTVANTFFASFIAGQTLYLICMIISYALLLNINYFTSIAVISYLTATFYHAMLWSVLVISVDWFLAAYFEKASETVRKYYQTVIGFVWMLSLIFCVALLCIYYLSYATTDISYYYSLFMYFINLVFMMFILFYFIAQKCNNRQSEYPTVMLSFVCCYLIMYLPLIITSIAQVFFYSYNTFTSLLAVYLIALLPIAQLSSLRSLNRERLSNSSTSHGQAGMMENPAFYQGGHKFPTNA